MSVWASICFFMVAAYAALLLVYWLGWLLIPNRSQQVRFEPKEKFSILIAARNEAEVIQSCLASIAAQKYPRELFEVLVLSDHSSDQTDAMVKEFKAATPGLSLSLYRMEDYQLEGKKAAITFGVEQAVHPYIILTDADCTRGENWLMAMDQMIQSKPVHLLYAPVVFSSGNWFEHFQSLEFAGLVGIGGAAIQLKNPNMCSAANLLFSKASFIEVGGYANNEHLASGDDEFLLHKVFKKYPKQVFFLKDARAIVYTTPNASVNQLTQQRRRWVSKSTKYENRYITAILVAAYLFNLSIFVNVLAGIRYPELLDIGLNQLLIKMGAEALLIGSILVFLRRLPLIVLVPLVQPFHILYVLIIGVWANIQTYTWKERELT